MDEIQTRIGTARLFCNLAETLAHGGFIEAASRSLSKARHIVEEIGSHLPELAHISERSTERIQQSLFEIGDQVNRINKSLPGRLSSG